MNIQTNNKNILRLLTGLLLFTAFFAMSCVVLGSHKVQATSQTTVTAQLAYNAAATNELISSQPTLSAGGDIPMPAANGTSSDAIGSVFDINYTPPCEGVGLNNLVSVTASANHSYSPQPFDGTDGFIMSIMDSTTYASLPNLTSSSGDAGLFLPGILTIGYSSYGGTISSPGIISGNWDGPSSNPLVLYLSSDLDGTVGATSTTTEPVVQLTFDTSSCPTAPTVTTGSSSYISSSSRSISTTVTDNGGDNNVTVGVE